MPYMPDLTDPRYLDEIGWFLYHEAHGRGKFGGSYLEERLHYSRLFLEEVLGYCGRDEAWLADTTIVSIGGGCTGDLATWPAAVKIAVDPLLYVYQKLDMLIDDVAGAATVNLPVGAGDMPLLDASADMVVCRNALDHMPDPGGALQEMHRILKPGGMLFLSVDIGGEPTPDEPTVFSVDSFSELVSERFEIAVLERKPHPHSRLRDYSIRALALRRDMPGLTLEKQAVLRAYMARLPKGDADS